MPTSSDQEAVAAAVRETEIALPPSLKHQVLPHWEREHLGKPDLLEKADPGIKMYRVRLLPAGRPRQPGQFWDASWCFYEIGAGRLLNPAFRWQVQFFMACNNKNCGKGRYIAAVKDILQAAGLKRPDAQYRFDHKKDFALLTISGRELNATNMGRDMAWIISETLPAFRQIPDLRQS
jgi:hypothetical protein